LVFPKTGSANNTLNINYVSADATDYFHDSTDGVSWTARTQGTTGFRIYEAKRLVTSVEISDTSAKLSEPRERMFPIRADLEEKTVRETMIAAASLLGKQRRIYDEIVVVAPTDRILPGFSCRLDDVKTGLSTQPLITGVKIEGHFDQNRLGADTITLQLEDQHIL